jgi:membrane-associated protease RseP (regulator of RpoE activity)
LSLPNLPAGPSTEEVWVFPPSEPRSAWRPPLPSPWKGASRNVVLFVTTAVSVFYRGLLQFDSLRGGVELLVGVFSILLAHEMGHYLACRYYRVDATLPFFIPSPWIPLGLGIWMPLSFMGTFGALIRIRDRFPDRKSLFDVGIAGPLAGFLVCLPVLALGIREARIVADVPREFGQSVAEPLLFQWAVPLLRDTIPADMTLSLGPLGQAAWFGLLVTALNLMPVGQLDGGHVIYAVFRDRAVIVSRLAWWACIALIVFAGPSWIVWSILLRIIGMRHPPTLDDAAPLGNARKFVACIGLIVFILSFLPNPFLFTWRDVFGPGPHWFGR